MEINTKAKILTEEECDDFIIKVKTSGSKLQRGIDRIRDYKTR